MEPETLDCVAEDEEPEEVEDPEVEEVADPVELLPEVVAASELVDASEPVADPVVALASLVCDDVTLVVSSATASSANDAMANTDPRMLAIATVAEAILVRRRPLCVAVISASLPHPHGAKGTVADALRPPTAATARSLCLL